MIITKENWKKLSLEERASLCEEFNNKCYRKFVQDQNTGHWAILKKDGTCSIVFPYMYGDLGVFEDQFGIDEENLMTEEEFDAKYANVKF